MDMWGKKVNKKSRFHLKNSNKTCFSFLYSERRRRKKTSVGFYCQLIKQQFTKKSFDLYNLRVDNFHQFDALKVKKYLVKHNVTYFRYVCNLSKVNSCIIMTSNTQGGRRSINDFVTLVTCMTSEKRNSGETFKYVWLHLGKTSFHIINYLNGILIILSYLVLQKKMLEAWFPS